MKIKVSVFVCLLSLIAGCASNQSSISPNRISSQPVVSIVPRIPWPINEYEKIQTDGRFEISGQAFMKTRGGEVKVAAGETVVLSPVTSYSKQFFDFYIRGKKERFQELGSNVDSRIYDFIKTSIADAEGRFRFQGVKEGHYFLYTKVFWEVPTSSGLHREGGYLGKEVVIPNENQSEIILTR